MKVAVLRFSGRTSPPEHVVALIGAPCDSIWNAGELNAVGRIHEDSGVTFVLSDAVSVSQMTSDIAEFIQAKRAVFPKILGEGWDAELDIGVTVGDSSQYTVTVSLEPSLLKLLASSGVHLSFSAYPTSDEAQSHS